MKRLTIFTVLLLTVSMAIGQSTSFYQRHGKLTSAEIAALDVSDTNWIYTAYDTDLGFEVINTGSGWGPRLGGSGVYTAGHGLSLSGNEFSVDQSVNYTWTGSHQFNGILANSIMPVTAGVQNIGNSSDFWGGISAKQHHFYSQNSSEDMSIRNDGTNWAIYFNTAGDRSTFTKYYTINPLGVPTLSTDVATKAYVDANSGGASGVSVLANGQVSLTNLTGPHAVTTVTHGIGVPPLPQNINVTLYRSNQQTNTGVQVAIGNITSTTFDIITSTTGTDDLVASWVVYSGGGGGTPATEGHTIQDNGTPVAQQPNLNFTGPGVTVTNDGLNNRTTIDISSGGGTDDQTSTEVPHTPSGGIAANNVGDAIVELDNEKLRVGTNQSTQYIQIGDNLSGGIKIGSPPNSVVIEGGDQADGDLVQLTVKDNSVDITGLTNTEIDAGIPAMVVTKSWILEKIARFYNANNTVRTYYTTENVTMTLSNKEIQSGTDIGSPVVNTILGATTATANLVDVDPAKIDVFRFDVLHSGGQWDITSTNGFVADGFTGDTVRVDGIGSVDFFETGVNTGIFYAVTGTNGSFVTTASLIVPTLDDINTKLYIDAKEFEASSNGTSVSPTDQSGNGTPLTSIDITKQTDADSDPTFAVNGSSSRISLANNFNFQPGVAQSIGIFISADGMGTGARFSKRDDSSGGSNDHFAIYNGYYYMGGTEGNPSFSSDSNVLITLTKTTGDVWYIYENGTQRATGAWTNETSTADLLIGAQVNGGGFNDYATGEFEVFFITDDFITNTEAGTIANEINTR